MLTVSTSFPRELGPGSEVPQGRPPVPGDSGPGPRACGVDRLSRGTRARVRGPAGSTSCPGGLGPESEGPRGRPAVPGTRACVRGHVGSTRCPRRSHSSPTARGVDHMSRAILARVQRPARSTSRPARLRPCSDGPRGQPAVPGAWGPCPKSLGVDQLSRATPALVQRPEGSTSSPPAPRARFRGTPVSTIGTGLFVPCPRVRGVDHIARATRFGSEGPRCRPAPLGDSGPGQRAHSVDQLSCATWARVRVPSASTRGPV